jgi:hypothetical protein
MGAKLVMNLLLEAFNRIMVLHTPDIETDSSYDFGSMWMTCSCGWDQNRDRVKNNYIEWKDHVREALSELSTGSNMEDLANGADLRSSYIRIEEG